MSTTTELTHDCPICETTHDTYTLACDTGCGCNHCSEHAQDALGSTVLPSAMDKRSLYRTAIVIVEDLTGIAKGEYVRVLWHAYNDTYTIRSASGVLQCMVPPSALDGFCL